MLPVNSFQHVVNTANSIAVYGQLFDIGTRVIRWDDRGGYNGYAKNRRVIREEDRKTGKEKVVKVIKGKRYGGRWPMTGRKLESLRQFVVHHTGGFLPGVCFNTLHNDRRLSVQFIQADNGTIYQTLDVKEIAWHAGKLNRYSCGVESCLYPMASKKPDAYNERRCKRLGLSPHEIGDCYIQGKTRRVFLMPDEQVETLARLVAGTWWARNKLMGVDDGPPVFPRAEPGVGLAAPPDSDFRKLHKDHTGAVLHANISPRKWDAAGVDVTRIEGLISDAYLEMEMG